MDNNHNTNDLWNDKAQIVWRERKLPFILADNSRT